MFLIINETKAYLYQNLCKQFATAKALSLPHSKNTLRLCLSDELQLMHLCLLLIDQYSGGCYRKDLSAIHQVLYYSCHFHDPHMKVGNNV